MKRAKLNNLPSATSPAWFPPEQTAALQGVTLPQPGKEQVSIPAQRHAHGETVLQLLQCAVDSVLNHSDLSHYRRLVAASRLRSTASVGIIRDHYCPQGALTLQQELSSLTGGLGICLEIVQSSPYPAGWNVTGHPAVRRVGRR